MGELAKKWRTKYGHDYDDLDDDQLEQLVLKKYPDYEDLADPRNVAAIRAGTQDEALARQAREKRAQELARKTGELPTQFENQVNTEEARKTGAEAVASAIHPALGALVTGFNRVVAPVFQGQAELAGDRRRQGLPQFEIQDIEDVAMGRTREPEPAEASRPAAMEGGEKQRRIQSAYDQARLEAQTRAVGLPGTAPIAAAETDPAIAARAQQILAEQKRAEDAKSEALRQRIGKITTAIQARQDISDQQKWAEIENTMQQQETAEYGKNIADAMALGRMITSRTYKELTRGNKDQTALDAAAQARAMEAGRQATLKQLANLRQAAKSKELQGISDEASSQYENFMRTYTDPGEFSRMALTSGLPLALAYATGGSAPLVRAFIQLYGSTAINAAIQGIYDGKLDINDAIINSATELLDIPAVDVMGRMAAGASRGAAAAVKGVAANTMAQGVNELVQENIGSLVQSHELLSGPANINIFAQGGIMGGAMGGSISAQQEAARIEARYARAAQAAEARNAARVQAAISDVEAGRVGDPKGYFVLPVEIETHVQATALDEAGPDATAEQVEAIADRLREEWRSYVIATRGREQAPQRSEMPERPGVELPLVPGTPAHAAAEKAIVDSARAEAQAYNNFIRNLYEQAKTNPEMATAIPKGGFRVLPVELEVQVQLEARKNAGPDATRAQVQAQAYEIREALFGRLDKAANKGAEPANPLDRLILAAQEERRKNNAETNKPEATRAEPESKGTGRFVRNPDGSISIFGKKITPLEIAGGVAGAAAATAVGGSIAAALGLGTGTAAAIRMGSRWAGRRIGAGIGKSAQADLARRNQKPVGSVGTQDPALEREERDELETAMPPLTRTPESAPGTVIIGGVPVDISRSPALAALLGGDQAALAENERLRQQGLAARGQAAAAPTPAPAPTAGPTPAERALINQFNQATAPATQTAQAVERPEVQPYGATPELPGVELPTIPGLEIGPTAQAAPFKENDEVRVKGKKITGKVVAVSPDNKFVRIKYLNNKLEETTTDIPAEYVEPVTPKEPKEKKEKAPAEKTTPEEKPAPKIPQLPEGHTVVGPVGNKRTGKVYIGRWRVKAPDGKTYIVHAEEEVDGMPVVAGDLPGVSRIGNLKVGDKYDTGYGLDVVAYDSNKDLAPGEERVKQIYSNGKILVEQGPEAKGKAAPAPAAAPTAPTAPTAPAEPPTTPTEGPIEEGEKSPGQKRMEAMGLTLDEVDQHPAAMQTYRDWLDHKLYAGREKSPLPVPPAEDKSEAAQRIRARVRAIARQMAMNAIQEERDNAARKQLSEMSLEDQVKTLAPVVDKLIADAKEKGKPVNPGALKALLVNNTGASAEAVDRAVREGIARSKTKPAEKGAPTTTQEAPVAPETAPETTQEAPKPSGAAPAAPAPTGGRRTIEEIAAIKALLNAGDYEKAADLARRTGTTAADTVSQQGHKIGYVDETGAMVVTIMPDGTESKLYPTPGAKKGKTGVQYAVGEGKREGGRLFTTGAGEALMRRFVTDIYKGSNPAQTWAKEVLQNVLDAFDMKRASTGDESWRGSGELRVDRVKVDGETVLKLTAEDDGIGMSPEFLEIQMLNPGRSGKRDGEYRGNFGLAKLAILGIAKNFTITTIYQRPTLAAAEAKLQKAQDKKKKATSVAEKEEADNAIEVAQAELDGVKKDGEGTILRTVVDGTARRWLGFEGGEDVHKAHIYESEKMPPGTETGTKFEVLEDKPLVAEFGAGDLAPHFLMTMFRKTMSSNMLTDNIKMFVDGKEVDVEKGKNWEPSFSSPEHGDWTENNDEKNKEVIDTPEATYEIYYGDETTQDIPSYLKRETRVELYNRGQLQSDQYSNDMRVEVDDEIAGVPRLLRVNVISKVNATSNKYPWTYDRKNLRDNGKATIKKFLESKVVAAKKATKSQYQTAEQASPKIPGTNSKLMLPQHGDAGQDAIDLANKIANSRSAKAIVEGMIKIGRKYLAGQGLKPNSVVWHLGFTEKWFGVHAPSSWYDNSKARILLNPWLSLQHIASKVPKIEQWMKAVTQGEIDQARKSAAATTFGGFGQTSFWGLRLPEESVVVRRDTAEKGFGTEPYIKQTAKDWHNDGREFAKEIGLSPEAYERVLAATEAEARRYGVSDPHAMMSADAQALRHAASAALLKEIDPTGQGYRTVNSLSYSEREVVDVAILETWIKSQDERLHPNSLTDDELRLAVVVAQHPKAFATTLAGTIMHEIVHEEYGPHNDSYAGELTDGMTVALIVGQGVYKDLAASFADIELVKEVLLHAKELAALPITEQGRKALAGAVHQGVAPGVQQGTEEGGQAGQRPETTGEGANRPAQPRRRREHLIWANRPVPGTKFYQAINYNMYGPDSKGKYTVTVSYQQDGKTITRITKDSAEAARAAAKEHFQTEMKPQGYVAQKSEAGKMVPDIRYSIPTQRSGAGITPADLRKYLPLGIRETLEHDAETGDYYVYTPQGARVTIRTTNMIEVDMEALREGYPDIAKAIDEGIITKEEISSQIGGVKYLLDGNAVIELVQLGELPHEFDGHIFFDHFATERERKILLKQFAKYAEEHNENVKETIANAIRDYRARSLENPGWVPTSTVGKFIKRIFDFFEGIYRTIVPDANYIMKQIVSGAVYQRTPQGLNVSQEGARQYASTKKQYAARKPKDTRPFRVNSSDPVLVAGGSAFAGSIPTANAGDPSFTIKASYREGPARVLFPDGTVRELPLRGYARLMDLPDSYPLSNNRNLMRTILGNGIPSSMMRDLVLPLLKGIANPKGLTGFSGGEVGFQRMGKGLEIVAGIEYNKDIAEFSQKANPDHQIINSDIRDVDFKKWRGIVDYIHMSPVCKNYSDAKAQRGEVEMDIETAKAVARSIREIDPGVVTVENVPKYMDSEAMRIITDQLEASGYKWDKRVYNSADFGVPQNRNRMLLRAVKKGELPAPPAPVAVKKGWWETVKDLMTESPNSELAPWQRERLGNKGIISVEGQKGQGTLQFSIGPRAPGSPLGRQLVEAAGASKALRVGKGAIYGKQNLAPRLVQSQKTQTFLDSQEAAGRSDIAADYGDNPKEAARRLKATAKETAALPKYSVATWLGKVGKTGRPTKNKKALTGREAYIQQAKSIGMSEEEIQKGLKAADHAAALFVLKPNLLPVDSPGSPLRGNIDFGFSLDFDTNCPRAEMFNAVVTEVQRRLVKRGDKKAILGRSEHIALSLVMRDHGWTPQCTYCYSGSGRANKGNMILKATTEGFTLREGKENEEKWPPIDARLAVDEEYRNEALKDPKVKAHWKAFMSYIGGSGANVIKPFSPWRTGELRRAIRKTLKQASKAAGRTITIEDVFEKMRKTWGLRIDSNTDFKAWHALDLIQAVLDLQIDNMPAHVYMKEEDLFLAFRDTGIKFNMSLSGRGRADYTIDFDAREGMDPAFVRWAAKVSPHAGGMLMAVNDEAIIAGMRPEYDDLVHQIIPYHRSGATKEETEAVQFTDYDSKTQAGETPLKKEELPDGEEPVEKRKILRNEHKDDLETYLALAEKHKQRPRFRGFIYALEGDPVKGTIRRGPDGKPVRRWTGVEGLKNTSALMKAAKVEGWNDPKAVQAYGKKMEQGYMKMVRDFGRVDTPFEAPKPNFDLEHVGTMITEWQSQSKKAGEVDPDPELVDLFLELRDKGKLPKLRPRTGAENAPLPRPEFRQQAIGRVAGESGKQFSIPKGQNILEAIREAMADRKAMEVKTGDELRAMAKDDPVGFVLYSATNYLLDNMHRTASQTAIAKHFGDRTPIGETYKGAYVAKRHPFNFFLGARQPLWMGGVGQLLVSRTTTLMAAAESVVLGAKDPETLTDIQRLRLSQETEKLLRDASNGDENAIAKLRKPYKESMKHTIGHEVLHGYRDTRDTNNTVMQRKMNLASAVMLNSKTKEGTTLGDELDRYFDAKSLDPKWDTDIQRVASDAADLYLYGPDEMKRRTGGKKVYSIPSTFGKKWKFTEEQVANNAGRTVKPRPEGRSSHAAAIADQLVGKTVFDWGSGAGGDVKYYKEAGAADVKGYDPNHAPEKPEGMADVVTNTFVGNVLPPDMRRLMWVEAMARAKEKLYIGVRSDVKSGEGKEQIFDGVLMGPAPEDGSLGNRTFQKYYTQDSLLEELRRIFPNHIVEPGVLKNGTIVTAVVSRKPPKGKLPVPRSLVGVGGESRTYRGSKGSARKYSLPTPGSQLSKKDVRVGLEVESRVGMRGTIDKIPTSFNNDGHVRVKWENGSVGKIQITQLKPASGRQEAKIDLGSLGTIEVPLLYGADPNKKVTVKAYDSGVPDIVITEDVNKKRRLVVTHKDSGLTFGVMGIRSQKTVDIMKKFAQKVAAIAGDKLPDIAKPGVMTGDLGKALRDAAAGANALIRARDPNKPRSAPAKPGRPGSWRRWFFEEQERLKGEAEDLKFKTKEDIDKLRANDPVGFALYSATNYLFDNMNRVAHGTDVGRVYGPRTDLGEMYQGSLILTPQRPRSALGSRLPIWAAPKGDEALYATEEHLGQIFIHRTIHIAPAIRLALTEKLGRKPTQEERKELAQRIAAGDKEAVAMVVPHYKREMQNTLAHELLHGFKDTNDTNVPDQDEMQAKMNRSAKQMLDTSIPDTMTPKGGVTLREEISQYFDTKAMEKEWEKEVVARTKAALKIKFSKPVRERAMILSTLNPEDVKALKVGKGTPEAKYVHTSALSGKLGDLAKGLAKEQGIGSQYNVVKFNKTKNRITFLSYPDFDSDPHPALAKAVLVDLDTGTVKRMDYSKRDNKLILHRKEQFISKDDPRYEQFKALSDAEEKAGLLGSNKIGYSNYWEELLKSKGLSIRGHKLEGRAAYSIPKEQALVKKVRSVLTPDLLSPQWRAAVEEGSDPAMGHCYKASEALWYLTGQKYQPMVANFGKDENGQSITHWWLEKPDGERLDPTATQLSKSGLKYAYANGKKSNFGMGWRIKGGKTVRKPSKEAQIIIERVKEA